MQTISNARSIDESNRVKSKPDVFISYSSGDKKTADAICSSLEQAGFNCWIAPRNIAPGCDYGEAIIDGISQSHLMVLVLSRAANASQQVKREVERAVNKNIPIIPFRIDDVPMSKALEFYLSTAHWLDAYTPPLSKHLKHLESAARSIIDGGAIDRSELNKVPGSWSATRRRWLIISASLVLLAIIGIAIVFVMKPQQRTFSYSLTVQKMSGSQKIGDVYESTGRDSYGNGWRYRMNLVPAQSGYLYMLNEGTVNYNVLFPIEVNNNHLAENQTMQTVWYFFDENPGIERVWIVWSTRPLSELDTVVKDTNKNDEREKLRVVDPAQIKTVRDTIARYSITEPAVDNSTKKTIVKGTGDVLVSLLELEHKQQ